MKHVIPLAFLASQNLSQEDFGKVAKDYLDARIKHATTEGEAAPLPPFGMDGLVLRTPPADGEDEKFELNYEFEVLPPQPDGSVTTEQHVSLAEKKAQLAYKVQERAREVHSLISPPLRMRRMNIEYGDALAQKERDESAMSVEQRDIITQQNRRNAEHRKVELHLADMEEEIDALTDKTIDTWQPAPFPKVGE